MNLARFVEWPASAFDSPESPVIIGVVGRDPFGSALDQAVAGEKISGRRVVIERYPNLSAVGSCHLLFIASSEARRVEPIISVEHGKPVLTVSEISGFATRHGGMVRIYTNDENKVRLEVNLEQARAGNLKVSSKLLQVAQIVKS